MATTPRSVHVGDVGTVFTAYIKDQDGTAVNLTGGSTIWKFQPPSGPVKIRTGVVPAGTDGDTTYTSVASDFDQPGVWKCQIKTTVGAYINHTNIEDIVVEGNLNNA